MEQRVNSIEEELKVLKSQIKAVLLDIKDYMSTGSNVQPYAPVPSGGHAGAAPVEGHAGSGSVIVSNSSGPGPDMSGGCGAPGPNMGGGYGAPGPNMGGGYGAPGPNMGGGYGAPGPNMGGGYGAPGPNMGGGYGAPGPNMGGGYGSPGPNMGGGYGAPGPNMGGAYGGPAPAAGHGYHDQGSYVEGPREEALPAAPHNAGTGVIRHTLIRGHGDRAASAAQPAGRQSAREPLDERLPVQADHGGIDESSENQVLDLLTVSVLAQWLAKAMPAIGREQLGKLVEIYDVTGNMHPKLKDTILLLADLCAGENPDVGPAATESVPAAVSVQLLIELDGLLRYRKGAVESVVMSMLLDRSDGAGKVGHG